MTHEPEADDRIAEAYGRWWAPVLAHDAEAILDLVATNVAAGARRILDLGTGTGTLGLAAVERWPAASVVGVDILDEMTEAAQREAARRLRAADRARFTTAVAPAGSLPFDPASFDLVVSSFVLQLVPSRARALGEARRVLRPGGRIAYVTWLAGGEAFAPDAVVDEVFEELGIEPRDLGEGAPDIASPSAAAQGLRRAGFRQVKAEIGLLEHRFDVEGYLGFLSEFDEEDLFASLVERRRADLIGRLRRRLGRLPPEALVLRAPIVRATGVVPGGGSGRPGGEPLREPG